MINILRADARRLPLPDRSVDLVVTSPPYFGLRSYTDGGEHYDGQIGSEETPGEWLAAMLDCTREWIRVLKLSGSIFVNLGDSYYSGKGAPGKTTIDPKNTGRNARRTIRSPLDYGLDHPRKSLLGMPWRYALACMDDLGLIMREDNIWSKPNPLPSSANDRCGRTHEYIFHFTVRPRYYSAVDEIREPHTGTAHPQKREPSGSASGNGSRHRTFAGQAEVFNPLGKMPGSVWEIPSQPLNVPPHLAVDHFAAFPFELPRRCILGWSPPGICSKCGSGRFPVAQREQLWTGRVNSGRAKRQLADGIGLSRGHNTAGYPHTISETSITGYARACTPYTDQASRSERGANDGNGGERFRRYRDELANPRGPVREYHFGDWVPAPTTPALIVDPFGGTGTTALVADVLGRTGISCDLSADYCRLARWRTTDPAERAKAMQVPKPPPVPDGQGSLFGLEAS